MKRLPVLFVLLLGCALPLAADVLEQIIVKVNGEIITKTDLEQRQIAFMRQQSQQVTEEDLKSDEALKKKLAEITPQLIVDAVDELLLMQRGKELGYRMTDEQFKNILDNIRKENKLETEEQLQAALKQEGLTMAELRKNLERQVIIARVQQAEVFGKIGITEDEAKAYYQSHLKEFTTPAAVTLREILASVPSDGKTVNVGLDEEARQKAEAARARILKGEDFGSVAAEVSDAASKANGGLVGPVNRDELAPAFQQVIEKLKVGDVSEILRTPRGYHFVKLDTATEAVQQPFEQARDQIADKVYASKRQAEFEKYLVKLRAQAIIEWKNDELKKAYEQRVAASTPSAP